MVRVPGRVRIRARIIRPDRSVGTARRDRDGRVRVRLAVRAIKAVRTGKARNADRALRVHRRDKAVQAATRRRRSAATPARAEVRAAPARSMATSTRATTRDLERPEARP